MSTSWYLYRAEKKYGPYSREQIEQMAGAGNLLATDLLWQEGTAAWVGAHQAFPPAASVPDLSGLLAQLPSNPGVYEQLIARKSELVAHKDELIAALTKLREQNKAKRAAQQALTPAEYNAQVALGALASTFVPPPVPAAAPPPQWHYAQNGARHGPFTLEQLRRLVQAGTVRPGDHVWTEGMTAWAPVSGLAQLQTALPSPPPAASPPAAAVQWFYLQNNRRYGPGTLEQVRGLLAAGTIKPTDLVWKTGASAWVAANAVAELQTAVPSKSALDGFFQGFAQKAAALGAAAASGVSAVTSSLTAPPSPAAPTAGNAASTTPSQPAVPLPASAPIEVKLQDLLRKQGPSLCADVRRCEAMLRDLCGDKTREAHLLIQSLKQQVPVDLMNAPAGTPPAMLLGRLSKRLEDNLGIAPRGAEWAVQTWGTALGIVEAAELVEEEEEEVLDVLPADPPASPAPRPAPSPATPPPSGNTVDLEDVLLDPASFNGQRVRLRGTYGSLFTRDSSFKLEQGDHEIWVFFSQLPREQKSMILRESEADGRNVVVEGVLRCPRNSDPQLQATSIAIEGMTPRAPQRAADGSIDLQEVLLDPTSFNGQRVRLRGTYGSLFTRDSSFKLEQGDHEIWVFFAQLPREQKSIILRESEADGRNVVAEGVLQCRKGSNPELQATNVSIEGMTPRVAQRAADGSIELQEVLLDPDSFNGQQVRLRGTYGSLFTRDGSFKLEQGDHEIWVFFSQLPREQKSMILRESEADGCNVVAEGVLRCPRNGNPELQATSVAIEGMTPRAPQRAADGSIDLAEVLLDPDSFNGQQVRLRGTYGSLFTRDSSFKLEQGDHEIWVFYSQLPREQKAPILRESEADGRNVVVEGILECRRGANPQLQATSVAIEGMTPKAPAAKKRQASPMPDWDGCGPCSGCGTIINMKFDNAVCPICGHHMSWQEAFQISSSFPGSLPRDVYSERDLP